MDKGIISSNIEKAVAILRNNDLVAIPTETVYGLAGNIYSEEAIRKIFEVKQRPLFNPLIVHIHSIDQLDKIAKIIPEKAKRLAQTFWPGSLTLVLEKSEVIPDVVTAGKSTVGIRMPNHPVTRELLSKLDFPLAAPSANPFNRISPTSAEHVEAYFSDTLQMVLQGGPCENGIESTIVGFEDDEPVLYRLGAISVEDIEKVVGKISVRNKKESAPDAPGMLAKHYAPRTKLYLTDSVDALLAKHKNKKIGVLSFSKEISQPSIKSNIVLSKEGDFKEAAARLYESLHLLDNEGLDIIIAERLPDTDLGKSINDRLERAAN